MSSSFQTGHGVINYTAEKPSYGFTDPYNTTEFDDELMKRGIVSYEQCMVSKGATLEEARQLKMHREKDNSSFEGNAKNEKPVALHLQSSKSDDLSLSTDEEMDDDDDDDFFRQYRSKRILELQNLNGQVVSITKSEWKKEVNEASRVKNKSVVVNFSYPCGEEIDNSISNLAAKFPHVKFVSIFYKDAVFDWPVEKLPAIFLYQDGSMVFQEIGFKEKPIQNHVQDILKKWKVVVLDDDHDENDNDKSFKYESGTVFGGRMMGFSTKPQICLEDDESSL